MPYCKSDVPLVYDLKHIDLFSGIGGFALAARINQVQTVAFVEKEPYAQKVLRKNFAGVPIYDDIRNFDGKPFHGVWLLTGGFPCQPFSLAGKRRGASDDRALWPEMLRVIDEAKPRWVLGENVPGIVSMELDNMLDDLENLGYSAWPIVIPACSVDASHRRDRVWIVAHANGERQPQPEGCERDERGWTCDSGKTIPDTDSARMERCAETGNAGRSGTNGDELTIGLHQGYASWQPEPAVGRVANGIPNRVDRLRGLGNAIVPQVAETLIRMMATLENKFYDQQPIQRPTTL